MVFLANNEPTKNIGTFSKNGSDTSNRRQSYQTAALLSLDWRHRSRLGVPRWPRWIMIKKGIENRPDIKLLSWSKAVVTNLVNACWFSAFIGSQMCTNRGSRWSTLHVLSNLLRWNDGSPCNLLKNAWQRMAFGSKVLVSSSFAYQAFKIFQIKTFDGVFNLFSMCFLS